MTRISKVLGYAAFAIMAAFGLFGGLFVVGETFADPGGWAAVLRSALWVVPLVAFSVFALIRPGAASAPLVAITALVMAFTVADAVFDIVPRDWGPVTAVAVFAIGVVLAFLGLHRAGLAGVLMVLAAFAQLVATVIGVGVHAAGDGPGPGAVLGGSSGVVIVPVMVVGALFLLSSLLERESLHAQRPPGVKPAH